MKDRIYYEDTFFSYRRTSSKNISKAHYHYNYEIYYLIKGSVRYIIEDEIWDLEEGDLVFIPKNTTHKSIKMPGRLDRTETERYLISSREKEIPTEFLHCFENHFYRPDKEAGKRIKTYFEEMHKESKAPDEYSAFALQANLVKILCEVSRMPKGKQDTKALSKNDLLMQDAIDYIKKHCEEDITLSFMANQFAFSKEYFSTVFKTSTGFGFNEYLNQMRVTKAIDFLVDTDMPITEISLCCGFNDSNYFAAVFKKIIGLTPLKYRKAYKNR